MAASSDQPRTGAQRDLVVRIEEWVQRHRDADADAVLWVYGPGNTGKSWAVAHADTRDCEVWHTCAAGVMSTIDDCTRVIFVSNDDPPDELRTRIGEGLESLCITARLPAVE